MTPELHILLTDYRRRASLTLRDFCKATGANASYWSQFERGHAPAPKEEYFYKKIKEVLNLSDSEFNMILLLRNSHTWKPEDDFFF